MDYNNNTFQNFGNPLDNKAKKEPPLSLLHRLAAGEKAKVKI